MSLAYRPDIDGLRAIAVGSVVLFHGGFSAFSGGFVGVDVFFVISGYLITSIIYPDMMAGRFSLADFYDRRIRRILPVLFLVLVVTTLASAFILLPSQMEDYARSLKPAVLFYANIHFMHLDSYFGPAAEELPLLHLWSLAIEEQFYIVFPLLLLVLSRFSARRVVVGLLVLIAVASFIHAQMELADDPRRAFYLLTSRVWEFLAGVLLAIAPLPKVSRKLAEGLGLLGLAALIVPVFVYSNSTPFPGLAAVPPVLGSALVIFAGASSSGTLVARLLSLKGFVQVGRFSYSLYLWHWPVLALAFVYKGRDLTDLESGLLIVLALLLSWLSWKYVEMPLRKPQAFLGRRGVRFASAALCALLVFGAAQALEAVKGQVWPLSPLGQKANALLAQVKQPEDCNPSDIDPPKSFRTAGVSCTMGPGRGTGHYEVLVWGDSHAGAAFAGIGEAAAKLGLTTRLLMIGGCPPLVDVRPVRNEDQGHQCTAFNTAVLEEVQEQKPRLVVVVGRWSLWTSFARRNLALTLNDLPGAGTPSAEGSRVVFPVAMMRTIKALRDTGADVLVLGQAPEFPSPPVQCVAYGEYFGGGSENCLAIPREKAMEPNVLSNALIAQVVKDRPDVSALFLGDIFCDAQTCRAGKGETFLFRDGNHLSRDGAQVLRDDPGLRAALEAVANPPAGQPEARQN